MSLSRGSFWPVVRVLLCFVWCFSLYYDVTKQPRLGHDWYIYKLVMLTNLNFVLTTIYSIFSALSTLPRLLFIRPAVDFVLFTAVFPVGVTTCALFWVLFSVDPELVMPAWVARLIPLWLNHVTHSLPVVYLAVELAASRREHPEGKTCLIISSLLVAFYFALILFVRAVDGYWLYPLLTLFEVEHFLIGYVVAVAGYFVLTRAGVHLNRLVGQEKTKSH